MVGYLIAFGLIIEYNYIPFFKIAFMIMYSTKMRSAFRRFIWTMREAYEAIFVYLLNTLIWSGFAYVIFFGRF